MSDTASVVQSTQTNRTVGETVVAAVVELTDTDPMAIEPLFNVVDPDALDTLFAPPRYGAACGPRRVEFTYADCDIVITDTGTVRVTAGDRELTKRWQAD